MAKRDAVVLMKAEAAGRKEFGLAILGREGGRHSVQIALFPTEAARDATLKEMAAGGGVDVRDDTLLCDKDWKSGQRGRPGR